MIPITETPIYRSPRFTAPFSVNFAVNQGFAVVGILAIGAICANGVKNGANGNPLAPMATGLMVSMVHPIAIGANGDRHWSHW